MYTSPPISIYSVYCTLPNLCIWIHISCGAYVGLLCVLLDNI